MLRMQNNQDKWYFGVQARLMVIQQLNQTRVNYKKMFSPQGAKRKFIKQIKLQGKKQYFPNKFYSPFDFMDKFNEALVKRYDLQVVEVKYVISKSRNMKNIDEQYSMGNFEVEKEFNNVYDIDNPFMKQILQDTVKLEPPKDYDYSKLQEENEAAKRREEERKLGEIDEALRMLADIGFKKKDALKEYQLRSLDNFKMRVNQDIKDSEVEVFVKAVMNSVVEDTLEQDKSGKNPIVVQSTGRQEIRVYLHPVKSDPQSIDLLIKMSPIADWSLCAFYPEGANVTNKSHGITYWNMRLVNENANYLNSSIKIKNQIALHKNKKGTIDGIEVYSFLFNEIVVKAVVNLAQIKRIQYVRGFTDQLSEDKVLSDEYYLHLTYPPKYFISVLKPDLGCDEGFIRNWERIENFMFLRNDSIINDQFFRLFLYGNTILKIRLSRIQEERHRWEQTVNIFNTIINHFKGTIQCCVLEKQWDLSKRVSSLNSTFKYAGFKNRMNVIYMDNQNPDKVWKLKYLILVLIRYNVITPPEVQKLLNQIESNLQDLDIYIYIFWQSVVLLGGVNPATRANNYLKYLQNEYLHIKQLQIADITSKCSSNSESIVYVFKAFLTPSGYIYNAPTPQMKGRLLKEYCKHSEHFLRVAITDDNEGTLKNQKYITKGALKSYMKGISIADRYFVPLGWSPSQLRSYSVWYINEYTKEGQRLSREQVLSFLGSFDKIENPAKKAARIGQAFSASWTYLCKQGQIKEKVIEDDVSSKGYMFTDGIGKISEDLIQKISLKLSIRDLSLLQIRYKGAKGLLVVDPRLPKSTIHLRKSMLKYECTHESAKKYLDILDWNKYKAGTLNRQTIILLKSLGIDDKVFRKKQQDHIDRISNLSFKDCSIFKHIHEQLNEDINNLEPANVTILQLLRAGFRLEEEPFFRGVLETMKKNGYHQLKQKSNIMIQKSARIIGIIDEYDILNEGELYCTILDNLDLKPKKEHVEGDVIITRNPCLHPADIRKMVCVSQLDIARRFQDRGEQNRFANLVNCIIFPKKGQIPVTAQISGSDLDGDNFFISWDRELIPKKTADIYLIDNPLTKPESKKDEQLKPLSEQYEEMLDFFIEYLNYEKLGQIDNSHLVKADQSEHFANDKDCIELAKIHGKAVDFPKTGFCPQVDPKLLVSTYPDFMEKQEAPEYISTSILGELYRDIQNRIQNLLSECEAKKSGKIDQEIIRELVSDLKDQDAQIVFDHDQIKEALHILLDYERELSGLIALVGVDTEYEVYSGNFSIAKDKVKMFGKNRLIATILALRSRYFEAFFSSSHLSEDKQKYTEVHEGQLEDPDCFSIYTRRKAMLFYLCSYIIKFNNDQSFLNDDTFGEMRSRVLSIYKTISYQQEGKYCGFAWFVIPKILINQKYRVRRILHKDSFIDLEKEEESNTNLQEEEDEDEVI